MADILNEKDVDKQEWGIDHGGLPTSEGARNFIATIRYLRKSEERWRTRATLAETVIVAVRKDQESHEAPNAGECQAGVMAESLPAFEEYDKARPHKNLGWANSWKENPQEFEDCRAAEHDTSDIDIGPPNRGIEHVVRCDLCRIVHRYDSSD